MLTSDLGGCRQALHEMCCVSLPHPGLGRFEGTDQMAQYTAQSVVEVFQLVEWVPLVILGTQHAS
jgi:hypothetical protein